MGWCAVFFAVVFLAALPCMWDLSSSTRDPLHWKRGVFIFFFNKFIYLFTYLWLHWVFIAACGLSLVVASRGYSSLQCVGFSLWWLLLLRGTGSRCAGFSSCGARA